MNGWIMLHRKILDNPVVCKDSDHFAIWGYLLLSATHDDYPALFNGNKIILKAGQLITGRKSISNAFGINESKTDRVLKRLEIEQQIEQQTCSKNRLITILNWQSYQSGEQQNEQQMNNKRTTSEQQVNTNNNIITKEPKKKEKIPPVKDDIPYQEIVDSFNRICTSLAPISKLTETRKSKVKTRWEEIKSLEQFEKIFTLTEASEFLTGKSSTWKANFDWLFKNENNYLKILEGNYTDKGKSPAQPERRSKEI